MILFSSVCLPDVSHLYVSFLYLIYDVSRNRSIFYDIYCYYNHRNISYYDGIPPYDRRSYLPKTIHTYAVHN